MSGKNDLQFFWVERLHCHLGNSKLVISSHFFGRAVIHAQFKHDCFETHTIYNWNKTVGPKCERHTPSPQMKIIPANHAKIGIRRWTKFFFWKTLPIKSKWAKCLMKHSATTRTQMATFILQISPQRWLQDLNFWDQNKVLTSANSGSPVVST